MRRERSLSRGFAHHAFFRRTSPASHLRVAVSWLILAALAGLGVCSNASAETVTVEFVTGGDDLRGGQYDNVHVRLIDIDGRTAAIYVNANRSQNWGGGSTHSVRIPLNRNNSIDRLAAIELETTFRGGFDGDNWNLERLRITDRANGTTLMENGGRPLFRFTGEQRTRRFAFVVHQCRVDADCDNRNPHDGTERCVAKPRPLDGMSMRQCAAMPVPPCPAGTRRASPGTRCETPSVDADGDGAASIATGGNDCDDHDASRYPGAPEVCDGHGRDEDCDVATVGLRDADRDGHNASECFNWGRPPGR